VLVLTTALSLTARAGEYVPARADALLEITDRTSSGSEAAITLNFAELEALERKEVVTSTLWTDGVNHFEGVGLRELLSELALEGSRIRVLAINDYAVEIPLEDSGTESAVLAFRMNGEPMSRRGKGPLWIVYPYDESAKFRTETIYARSVWQLNRIEVIE